MSDKSKVSEQKAEQALKNASIEYVKHCQKTLVATARLSNGFEVTVSASCVDPADYDHSVAEEICRERLKERVWEFLGYQQHPDL